MAANSLMASNNWLGDYFRRIKAKGRHKYAIELQRLKLLSMLDELESKGDILYRVYISRDAVMSCYVRDVEDGHVHFVDGSDGGILRQP